MTFLLESEGGLYMFLWHISFRFIFYVSSGGNYNDIFFKSLV